MVCRLEQDQRRSAAGIMSSSGGAAGCVVAGRLSQTMPEARTLLIEAGGTRLGLTTKIPSTAFIASTSPRRNWNSRPSLSRGLNGRRLSWFQGRILGGSGSINRRVPSRRADRAVMQLHLGRALAAPEFVVSDDVIAFLIPGPIGVRLIRRLLRQRGKRSGRQNGHDQRTDGHSFLSNRISSYEGRAASDAFSIGARSSAIYAVNLPSRKVCGYAPTPALVRAFSSAQLPRQLSVDSPSDFGAFRRGPG